MKEQSKGLDLVTVLVVGVLVLQVVLSAGLLVRVNQVYRLVVEGTTSSKTVDISLVGNVSPDDDPFIGTTDAPVTIVEFSDFSCVHCRQAQDTLEQVREHFGNQVRIVYRDFPLEGPGSQAFTAALAGECADEQGKFWEMHDALFDNQPVLDKGSMRSYAASIGMDTDQFADCLESAVYQSEVLGDVGDGRSYGVSATPTFFVNGRRLVGTISFPTFQRAIEESIGQ